MPATNLWPDFKIESKPRGLRQMLEEAGQGLKERTNGIVEFRVWPRENDGNRGFPFRFRCDLYVAKLDYNFQFVYVNASATGFPAEVLTDSGVTTVSDEAALYAALERIFHSDKTKAIVENLVSMATE